MSFKRRKFDPHPIRYDVSFTTTILSPVVTTDGSTIMSVVDVPVSEMGTSIPNVEDYTLEKLINANITLNPVPASITGFVSSDTADSFAEKLLDSSQN